MKMGYPMSSSPVISFRLTLPQVSDESVSSAQSITGFCSMQAGTGDVWALF